MAIEVATAAQQLEILRRSRIASAATQRFAQRADPITAAQAVAIDAALVALSAALLAAGVSGLPTTSAIVASGASLNVANSAGALVSPGTATVAASAVTDVRLAATKTILTNGTKFSGVTITGSGTFFTPTIAAGVMTGGVLSAS